MGSQHLPSFTFYAILDPLDRPSQSIVGCIHLKVEGTALLFVCIRERESLREREIERAMTIVTDPLETCSSYTMILKGYNLVSQFQVKVGTQV